jgi:hypothetical protein
MLGKLPLVIESMLFDPLMAKFHVEVCALGLAFSWHNGYDSLKPKRVIIKVAAEKTGRVKNR